MSPPCPSTLRHMYLYTRRFPPNAHVHSSIPPICICTYVYVHPSIIHPFLSVRSNCLQFSQRNQISFMFICKCPCTHGGIDEYTRTFVNSPHVRVHFTFLLVFSCKCTLPGFEILRGNRYGSRYFSPISTIKIKEKGVQVHYAEIDTGPRVLRFQR